MASVFSISQDSANPFLNREVEPTIRTEAVKNYQFGFLFAQESNRFVSIEKNKWVQVQTLDIPNDGLLVWLRDFGHVKFFRTHLKNQDP